jgi:tetratricopeptide (TPR) repeat protein
MVQWRRRRKIGPEHVSTALALWALACSGAAHAQSDRQASEFFRAGEAAYGRADFPAAARAFEEAHRRAPHAATLYNAGLAWELAGEAPRAADDYDSALRLGSLDPRQATDANIRLAALEKRLARLAIIAPAGNTVSVAHVEKAEIPVLVHVQPGQYEVTLFRPSGHTDAVPVVGTAGARTEIAFDADLAPLPAAPAVDLQTPVAAESDRRRTWAFVGAASGCALGGAAIYLGLEALRARDTYNQSGHTDHGAYDRATSLRTWTNVLWIGAGVAAVASLTLFVTAPKRQATALGRGARWAAVTLALNSASLTVGF